MAFTVVPLHNLRLSSGTRIPFGTKFVLQNVPGWLKKDSYVDQLSRLDRMATLQAQHALVSEYSAAAIGEPDPAWKGRKRRSIQDLRFQAAYLVNIAIWLQMPSPVCFTLGFHALTNDSAGRPYERPAVLSSDRIEPFYCHPNEEHNEVSANHLVKAAELCERLETIPRNNALWSGLRAFSGALSSYFADYRFPLFWQGLESLFGSDTDRYGMTKRLCDRISYFLADNESDRMNFYQMVNDCYDMRSQIVHGRQADHGDEEDPEIDNRMEKTEAIVRTVVRHILKKPSMIQAFVSKGRNDFLQAWVDSKQFIPPLLARPEGEAVSATSMP
jgi:hypothetical protein